MYLEPPGLDLEDVEKDWAHLIQFLTSSDRIEAKDKVEKVARLIAGTP